MNNTVVIKPMHESIGVAQPIFNAYTLKIDCPDHSNIILSDKDSKACEECHNYFSSIGHLAKLTEVYINVNSMLTCESFMVDFIYLYMAFTSSEITFKVNDCFRIVISLQKDSLTFAGILASMYAIWLAFCGDFEKRWLANVLAQPSYSDKPSIEIITKTLQGLYLSKQFNLEAFDIKHIPYIKDVYKNCTYEFLEDTIHILDKEQIISIIEELSEEDGERKAMLIQAAALKDNDKRRFEL